MSTTGKLTDEQWLIQHLEDDAEACSAVNGSKDITTKDARRAEVTVKRLIRERDDARRASQAAPAPQDEALQFLPMKWEDRGNKAGDIYCDTEVGQYVIGNIRGEIMVLRRFIDNGQMEDETVGYGDDHDDGRKVAQADYEARLVSCFAYPAAAAPAPSDGLREALRAVYDWQAGSHVLPTELWVQVRAALTSAPAHEGERA